MNKLFSAIKNGLLDENPTFRLVLGTCPTLAVTTAAWNGVGMGLAVTFVLVFSNLFVSLLRRFIPHRVRIPCFILIIAAFSTIVDLCLQAFVPALSESLGIFIPLIVVNCIILARAEAVAYQHGPLISMADGLGCGLGFTIAITLIAIVREVLGSGTFFGLDVTGGVYVPMAIMVKAPGGFLVYGLLLAAFGTLLAARRKKEADE
ncbi:MAG: electron transport complex subunit E [Eubacteriales bacterium]|nr:electron transport complex subunit E [Eubacteriales bacterium]